MSLILPSPFPGSFQTNLTAASRVGTAVAGPVATNTKNTTYTTLIATTSFDTFGVWIRIKDSVVSAAISNALMDLAVGAAAAERVIVPNIVAGNAGAGSGPQGRIYYFPVYIPAGARLSATLQSTNASESANVAVWLCQQTRFPWVPGPIADYGTDTANSRGTSVTPASGSYGSWTQISAGTSRDHRHWTVLPANLADTTLTDEAWVIDIGFGPDSANVEPLITAYGAGSFTGEEIWTAVPLWVTQSVPSGTKLFARMAAGSTEARSIIIYGAD